MRRCSSLLILSLVVPMHAHAQTTASGSIRGVARDDHGAVVPGVLVSAVSPSVPGTHTAITGRSGEYRLGNLPPGDYTVIGELAAYARFVRTPVTIRAGLNLEIDLHMRVGAIDEVVEVRAETPLLETERAGQSVNISGDLLRGIPLLERHEWSGALTISPGVTSWQGLNNSRLFSVHGAESSANIVQIDGIDVASASQESAILHVGLSAEAIDDIQIKTAGLDASAPLGQGGVVNIATASGTNRVRGAAAFSFQPRAWNDSNLPGGDSSVVAQRQTDASIGAPLLKDRLWAFAAYRYTDARTAISRTAAQLQGLAALVPGFSPFDSTNKAHFWLAKLTAQISSSHQLIAAHQRDHNPTMTADPSGAYYNEESVGGSAASVRLSSIWSNRFASRLAASYNNKRRNQPDPRLGKPFQRVYESTVVSAGRLVGTGLALNTGTPLTASTVQPNSKLTISFDATLDVSHGWGSHQLQTGMYAQPRTRIGREHVYINGGFTIDDQVLIRPGDYNGGTRSFHRVLMDTVDLTAARSEGDDYALYVQDAWRPTSRLTINAGLRVDRVSWRDRVFDVTSMRSTEVGPRVGMNYALTADARNIARAHWVRVHDRPQVMAASVGSPTLGQRDLYDVNLDGSFETVFVTPSTFVQTRGRTLDPDLHVPFVQEWGAGYTRQLKGRISAGVDVVSRDFRRRPALLETNGLYAGSRFVGYLDEAFNETYLITNNRWNWPTYTSLELSLTKQTTRVQGLASYVRQWRHMSGTWQPHDPASFVQPSAFPNDRGIGSTTASLAAPVDANSLTGTHMAQRTTSAGQWQDHTVRVGVSCTGPWSLLVAGSYAFQSGIWSGPIVERLAAPDPAFGPTNMTLSNGRIVTNPLSTNIRFAYPTRADGQLTTPNFHLLNLRVGHRFALRGLRLDAALDVFNLTNHGADLGFENGANQTYNPIFGQTAFRQLPRSAQGWLRASF